jgi:hypothetical protein
LLCKSNDEVARRRFGVRLFATIMTGGALAISADLAQGATVAPHRALYDVKLDAAAQGASLRAVDGRLGFEIMEAGCDGWTVNFRMANRYVPSEGSGRVVDSQSATFESRDFGRLDYAEKTFVNNKLDSESRLQVKRDSREAPGNGTIKLPQTKEFTLEGGAKFPMQHQLHMMELAAAGQTHDASVVFDGSDGDKAMKAVTFIGKARDAGQPSRGADAAAAAPLSALKAWPVTVSYFDATDENPDVPAYQVSFDLYENGVATALTMDYGSFKLSATLKSLEMLPKETCN